MEQRFAQGAGFFGAVHNGNLFNRVGDNAHKIGNREGAEQFNFEYAHFLAFHGFYRVLGYVRAGTHNHYQSFGVFVPNVLEQIVFAAGHFFKFGHFFFYNAGHGVIKFVDGFARLEVHIRVGGGTAHGGVFRVEAAAFVLGD